MVVFFKLGSNVKSIQTAYWFLRSLVLGGSIVAVFQTTGGGEANNMTYFFPKLIAEKENNH